MREILFRAKSLKSGTWTQGYLFRCWEHAYIAWGMVNDNADMVEVDPETVCQYTGLTDKNGRKIFVGDIVEVCTFGFNPERFVTEVIYDKCSFRLKNGRNMFYFGQSDFSKMDDGKVIGNIFDNPELIGDQP